MAEFRSMEMARRDARLQNSKPMKLEKGAAKTGFLHIVYVMTWNAICGGSKIILEHCNRIAQRGHRVSILCHFEKPQWFALDERIAYIQPDFTEVLCEHIPPCDVIVATYWREIYECIEQKIAPVVYFEQGDMHLFDPGVWDAYTLSHIKRQIELAPFVCTVSGYAAEKLHESYGVEARIFPNAVDKTIFYPDPEAKRKSGKTVITAIGPDYIYFKRIPHIVSVVNSLREHGHDIEFIWITPGPSDTGIKEDALISPPQSIIADSLRRTDIFVCASLYEAFGLPVLEAMTCGAAVVTTDCGGVRDFVRDEENAFIVQKDDIADMAEKIEWLINDEELRSYLSAAGTEEAEKFDWDDIIDRLIAYYREIAGYRVLGEEQTHTGCTISLCMIVKDEEKVLSRCLESIKDAVDEIIIVDTGSRDRTKQIAREYTDKVYDYEWEEDFSAARNFAFSKATKEYQMWLDADDILPESECYKLIKLKECLEPDVDIVTMKYITHFDAAGNPIHSSTRERLLRRERGYLWEGPVHECIPLIGKLVHCDIEVHHKKIEVKAGQGERNLRIYEALERSGKAFDARAQYYFARELKDHGLYAKSAYYFEKFLEGKRGWVEDNIGSCYNLAIIYTQLGDLDRVLPILFSSFAYAPPRAEICCEIGHYYKRTQDYAAALSWFRIASTLTLPDTLGFILIDCWGYIPNIECCACCMRLQDYKNAQIYNEAAAKIRPYAPEILKNRKMLEGRVSI